MLLSFNRIQFEVHYLKLTPSESSWYMPPHSHPQYEFHFITKGKGINRIGSQRLDLYPGMLYMAPPGEVHEQLSDKTNPMDIFHIAIHINGLVKSMPRIYQSFSPMVRDELLTILTMQRNSGARDMLEIQLRIMHLIWSVISPVLEREKLLPDWVKPDFDDDGAPHEVVETALQYIMLHKMENPTVSDISKHCHISPRQLSRIFAGRMNATIHEFIQRERFLWACKELTSTGKSIEEISENLNLNSKQYFCHWFKSHASKSPSAYRSENSGLTD